MFGKNLPNVSNVLLNVWPNLQNVPNILLKVWPNLPNVSNVLLNVWRKCQMFQTFFVKKTCIHTRTCMRARVPPALTSVPLQGVPIHSSQRLSPAPGGVPKPKGPSAMSRPSPYGPPSDYQYYVVLLEPHTQRCVWSEIEAPT